MSYYNVYGFGLIEPEIQASTDDTIHLYCWRPLLNANFPDDFDIDAHIKWCTDWYKYDYMSTNWIDVLFNPDSSSRIPLDVSKHHIVSRNLPEHTDQVQFSIEPLDNMPGYFFLGGHSGFHFLLPVATENNPSLKRLYFAKLTEDEQLVYFERRFWNNTYRKRQRMYLFLLRFFSDNNYKD